MMSPVMVLSSVIIAIIINITRAWIDEEVSSFQSIEMKVIDLTLKRNDSPSAPMYKRMDTGKEFPKSVLLWIHLGRYV